MILEVFSNFYDSMILFPVRPTACASNCRHLASVSALGYKVSHLVNRAKPSLPGRKVLHLTAAADAQRSC